MNRRSASPPSLRLRDLGEALPKIRDRDYRKKLVSNQTMFHFIINDISQRIDDEEVEELNIIFNKYRFDARIVFNHPSVFRYDLNEVVSDNMLVDILVYLLKDQLFNVYTLNSELKSNASKYRIILMDKEGGIEDIPSDYYFDIVEIKTVKTFSVPVYEND